MRVSFRTASVVSLSVAGLVVVLGFFLSQREPEEVSPVAVEATVQDESPSEATSQNALWPPKIDLPDYLAIEPSAVPNAGLVIDEKSLWWGEVLETDQPVTRELRLKNPTERDLHIVFSQYPCGFSIEHSPFTVPAHGEVVLPMSLHASTRDPGARNEFVVMRKKFAPTIQEFPGRHPGWTVHCHVTRSMTIDEGDEDRAFVVTPLREISAVTASVNGQRAGVTVEGPDKSNRYLVFVDHESLRKALPKHDRARLLIRGHLPFGGITDRELWVGR